MASEAIEVPPVGETEAGFSEPELEVFAGSATTATPTRGWPAEGMLGVLPPASATTNAKSPTAGIGTVSDPFTALRFGVTMSQVRSEEHTSELQSHLNLVCRLLLEKKKIRKIATVEWRWCVLMGEYDQR